MALSRVLMWFSVRGEEPLGALPEGGRYSICGVSGAALNASKADADSRSGAGE